MAPQYAHDPALMDASATNVWAGSVRVRWRSRQRRQKRSQRRPTARSRVYWGNPAGSLKRFCQRQKPKVRWTFGSAQTPGDLWSEGQPQHERTTRPKIPNAWGNDRFILTNTARGAHRPHAVHPHSSEAHLRRALALGRKSWHRAGASRNERGTAM